MSTSFIGEVKSNVTPQAESASPAAKPGSFWSRLWQASQTLVVVAVLIGLAAWGHSTDWSLPKFSTLFGGEQTETVAWCEEHNIPSSICVECNPTLLPPARDFGWCAVHGIMQCPFEHPELAQTKAPTTVTPVMLERVQHALAVRPRAENNSRCALHRKRIQFESPAALEKIGVDIALVAEKPVVETISTNGEIVYDETRTAHLSSRVAGTLYRVLKKIGDRVEKGEILALVEGAEVGEAKSVLMRAISQLRLKKNNVERLRPLAGNAVPGQVFVAAETEANDAAIAVGQAIQTLVNQGLPVNAEEFAALSNEEIANRLQMLGLPTDIVFAEGSSTASSNLLPLRAPMSGVIVSRTAVEGEVIATNTQLFDVTDTSHLWLNLNLRQQDAKYVSYGQPVLFRASDGAGEQECKGTVSWISTGADELTRTVMIRVDLPNPDGRLRANTFGTGRVVLRDEPKAIVVPSEAVHWDGTCSVVFVRDRDFFQESAPKVFHVRCVRLGVKDGSATEIIAGLLPGEVIASKNSVLLEAQLLKANLGAGCGCCEGK